MQQTHGNHGDAPLDGVGDVGMIDGRGPCVSDPPVPFSPRAPEAIFGVVDISGTSSAVTGRMRSGPWLRTDDDRPAPGGIGVFVDTAVGGAVVAHHPPNGWAVTTDLAIAFVADIPSVGPDLLLRGHTVGYDENSGVATGTVCSGGTTVATVFERVAYVNSPPDSSAPTVHIVEGTAASTLYTLGGRMVDDGVEIVVGDPVANPGGSLHGGVSVYLTELTSSSVVHRLDPGLRPATLQLSFSRPGGFGEQIRFAGRMVHTGRNSAVVDVDATNAAGKVVTRARVTYHRR